MSIKKTLLACIGLLSISYGSTGGEMPVVLANIPSNCLDSCKAYCESALNKFRYNALVLKYWKCFGEIEGKYFIVCGKICVGIIKPKHGIGIIYKSDTGYGVVMGYYEYERQYVAKVVIKRSTRQFARSGTLDTNRTDKKEAAESEIRSSIIGALLLADESGPNGVSNEKP